MAMPSLDILCIWDGGCDNFLPLSVFIHLWFSEQCQAVVNSLVAVMGSARHRVLQGAKDATESSNHRPTRGLEYPSSTRALFYGVAGPETQTGGFS